MRWALASHRGWQPGWRFRVSSAFLWAIFGRAKRLSENDKETTLWADLFRLFMPHNRPDTPDGRRIWLAR